MTTMAIGDVSTGVASAMAIGFAIIHRDRTGEGQHLDASLLDTYFHMHEANVPMIALRGDKFQPTRAGSIPPTGATAGIYPCGGGYVFICAVPHQWPQVVKALAMPELAKDPRFVSARQRAQKQRRPRSYHQELVCGF